MKVFILPRCHTITNNLAYRVEYPTDNLIFHLPLENNLYDKKSEKIINPLLIDNLEYVYDDEVCHKVARFNNTKLEFNEKHNLFPNSNYSALTIMFYVKFEKNENNYQIVYESGIKGSSYSMMTFGSNTSGDTFFVADNGETNATSYNSHTNYVYEIGKNIDTNKWYHICIKHAYSGGLSVFINGKLEYENQSCNAIGVINFKYLNLGYSKPYSNCYFKGKIFDFVAYNKFFSDEEIYNLYNTKLKYLADNTAFDIRCQVFDYNLINSNNYKFTPTYKNYYCYLIACTRKEKQFPEEFKIINQRSIENQGSDNDITQTITIAYKKIKETDDEFYITGNDATGNNRIGISLLYTSKKIKKIEFLEEILLDQTSSTYKYNIPKYDFPVLIVANQIWATTDDNMNPNIQGIYTNINRIGICIVNNSYPITLTSSTTYNEIAYRSNRLYIYKITY